MRNLLVIAAMLTVQACGCTRIDPGNIGIKVELTGDNKGVDPKELSPGYYYVGPFEQMYEFPVFEQNYAWAKGEHVDESFTFQTKEGLSVNADIGINYHIEQGHVVSVFQKYRRGMDEITHLFLRNAVRDAINTTASTLPVEAVYGEGKEKMMNDVLNHVQREMEPVGINVSKIFVVGTFHLPPQVTEQLNAKITATQTAIRVENELRQATAEAQKKVAEAEGAARSLVAKAEGDAKAQYLSSEAEAKAILVKAEAQAKANRLLADSMSERLLESQRIQKWKGDVPMVSGSGGSTIVDARSLSPLVK